MAETTEQRSRCGDEESRAKVQRQLEILAQAFIAEAKAGHPVGLLLNEIMRLTE